MQAVNSRLIVEVDMSQKDSMIVCGTVVSSAIKFETNYREKSPVIAKVISGNTRIKNGQYIICHHNHFYSPSPYQIEDNIFSIPYNKTIFATISIKGKLKAVCGNILGSKIPIPNSMKNETYIDRILVKDKGWTSYKNGSVILCRHNAPYDIVYNFEGVEYRVTKVNQEQVCGIIK